ncbi:hypothetical protein Pta02_81850 [Planobispora takensis]|uniref:Uncharacterized protein n=1 Tax=Planobispora takensis TaxID=1367882 RepID=A0A8J3T670_9ACTN|nr:hypothetical protein Pta02_81850 [Planobispora takensis]
MGGGVGLDAAGWLGAAWWVCGGRPECGPAVTGPQAACAAGVRDVGPWWRRDAPPPLILTMAIRQATR